MEVDLILKIAGIGMVVAILNIVLEKADKEEYAFLTTIIGLVIVLGIVINLVASFFNNVKVLFRF